MIKVLHLVSSLSVGSGLMSVIMNYYRHLDRNQVEFGFVYFMDIPENTYKKEIEELGGDCFLIQYPKASISYMHYVDTFMEDHKDYDILHIHELYLSFIFSKSAKEKGNMKIVGHAHTTRFAEKKKAAVRNRLLCLPNKWLFDYKFACSLAAGKTYFGKNVESDQRFSVIKNAIELEKYAFNIQDREEYRTKYGIDEDTIVIGHIGRFPPKKKPLFYYGNCEGVCIKK